MPRQGRVRKSKEIEAIERSQKGRATCAMGKHEVLQHEQLTREEIKAWEAKRHRSHAVIKQELERRHEELIMQHPLRKFGVNFTVAVTHHTKDNT